MRSDGGGRYPSLHGASLLRRVLYHIQSTFSYLESLFTDLDSNNLVIPNKSVTALYQKLTVLRRIFNLLVVGGDDFLLQVERRIKRPFLEELAAVSTGSARVVGVVFHEDPAVQR